MDTGQFKESCKGIGEAFFYQRVREALTNTLPEGWSDRKGEYVSRAKTLVNNAITGYNLSRRKSLNVGKCFTKEGENLLSIYLKVTEAIPNEMKKAGAEKELLKGFRGTLAKIESGAEISDNEKVSILGLVENLQEEADSRNSRNAYGSMFSCLA